MSDYLNNIALRSLGIAPVVQPRVPQLFEQAAAPSAPSPDTSLQAEFAAVSRSNPTESFAGPAARNNYRETAVEHPGFNAEKKLLMDREPTSVDGTLPATSQTVGPSPVETEDSAPARLVSPAQTVTQQSQSQEPLTSSMPAQLRAQPQSRREQSSAFTARVIARRPSATMSLPNAIGPSLTQNTPAEFQPLPIKISIGRVEVRAVMPSAPPKPAASPRPKPALSLESYLKQREEGKR